ncbi:hypothetical protein CYMTET_34767, partial [Cymbomonas tetramitiformis]
MELGTPRDKWGWSATRLVQGPALETTVIRYPALVNVALGTLGEDPSLPWFPDTLQVLQSLGGSLWMQSSFTPGAICDFMLGTAFHARTERIHISILQLCPLLLK